MLPLILLTHFVANATAQVPFAAVPGPQMWGVNGRVNAILRVDDALYVGGDFSQLVSPDGSTNLPAQNLAVLDANTGQPIDWRPSADGVVFALAASPQRGEIYIGGTFTAIDGYPRSRFAAVSTNGVVLWSADANSTVKAILVSEDTIYLGGNFRKVANQIRSRIAAIQPPGTDGVVATVLPWNPSITSTNDASYWVAGIAAANGDVVAVGQWTTANEMPEPNQARFDAVTGELKPWFSNVLYPGKCITTDGVNYYGGFSGPKGRVVAWRPDGRELWRSGANGDVQAIAFTGNHIIIGGHFTTIVHVSAIRLAAFTLDGVFDTNWAPSPDDGSDRGVWAMHAEEKLYIGGSFTTVGSQPADRLAMFSPLP